MTGQKKDHVAQDGNVELDDDQLDDVQGAGRLQPLAPAEDATGGSATASPWKLNSFDGKGHDDVAVKNVGGLKQSGPK